MSSDPRFGERYDIKGMVANGSPIDCANIPSDVPVLSLQNGNQRIRSVADAGDVIARVDFDGRPGTPDNIANGYLGPVGADVDPNVEHQQLAYYANLVAGTRGTGILDDWANSHPEVSEFIPPKGRTSTEQYNVRIGRETDH